MGTAHSPEGFPIVVHVGTSKEHQERDSLCEFQDGNRENGYASEGSHARGVHAELADDGISV